MLLNMSINSYVYHQFLIILISNTRMGSSRSLSKEWKIINRMPQTSKIANNKDIFHRSESFPFKIAGDCSRIYFSIRGSRAHLLQQCFLCRLWWLPYIMGHNRGFRFAISISTRSRPESRSGTGPIECETLFSLILALVYNQRRGLFHKNQIYNQDIMVWCVLVPRLGPVTLVWYVIS